jgi:hypothetical protein
VELLLYFSAKLKEQETSLHPKAANNIFSAACQGRKIIAPGGRGSAI